MIRTASAPITIGTHDHIDRYNTMFGGEDRNAYVYSECIMTLLHQNLYISKVDYDIDST